MNPSPPSTRLLADICDVISDIGVNATWRVRVHAAALVIGQATGVEPMLVPVRAVAYGRSAVQRLGGALMPHNDAELAHFREQVHPAMMVLGHDEPHVVIIVNSAIIELAGWIDQEHAGVLLQPFVAKLPTANAHGWTIGGLRFGVTVSYELLPGAKVPTLDETDLDIARQLAMSASAHLPCNRPNHALAVPLSPAQVLDMPDAAA